MVFKNWRHLATIVPAIAICGFGMDRAAQADEQPERCNIANAISAFQSFYPGTTTVNQYTIEDGEVNWTIQRPGGLGDGVVNCQFRLFAAAVPFLPDVYEFCEDDVFLGGLVLIFPYLLPDSKEYLDLFYPDTNGYRNKAIAEFDLVEHRIFLTRDTYIDEGGTERPVGDGGPDDPSLADPTAGDPKFQDTLQTSYKDFRDEAGNKLVMRQDGFFGQLEAGKYWVATEEYFMGFLDFEFPPVEIQIVTCD